MFIPDDPNQLSLHTRYYIDIGTIRLSSVCVEKIWSSPET